MGMTGLIKHEFPLIAWMSGVHVQLFTWREEVLNNFETERSKLTQLGTNTSLVLVFYIMEV